MAIKFDRVNPGDLIKAELVNKLLETLEKLDERVTTLEQMVPGKAVIITSITSKGSIVTGPVDFNSRIEINGLNFELPGVLNEVFIGGVPPKEIKGSSTDKQLVLDVPQIPNLPATGASVPVFVKTLSAGVASTSLMVKPPTAIPTGDLFVSYANPPFDPKIISAPSKVNSYIYGFQLEAKADLPGDYHVTATSTGPNGTGAGWPVELVEDGSEQPRASNAVPLAATGKAPVRVRIDVPAGLTAGAASFIVLSAREASTGTTLTGKAQVKVTVGSAPEQPEPRVRITLGATESATGGTRVMFTRGTTGKIHFKFNISETGKYDVSFAMRGVSQPGPATWEWRGQDQSAINVAGSSAPEAEITAAWKPGAGATDTDMIVKVVRASPPLSVEYWQPVGVTG